VKQIKVLDLFCGCGGAAVGMKRAAEKAGIEIIIIGVDIALQRCYPFFFAQDDISEWREIERKDIILTYDFIWASPPCLQYTPASSQARQKGVVYPELISFTRELIAGIPSCIENVPQAPIRPDCVLTGHHFGLKTIRRRVFELQGFFVLSPPKYASKGLVTHGDYITCAGYGTTGKGKIKDFQSALGIDWTKDRKALVNAVPPAYSEYIFSEFLRQLWK